MGRVKQHIRPYLKDIFSLIEENWSLPQLHYSIVVLVEELSLALRHVGDVIYQYLILFFLLACFSCV